MEWQTRPIIVLLPWPARNVTVEYLYGFQNSRCFYCDRFMKFCKYHFTDRPTGYTIDHVFPASYGFTLAGNMVLACRKCNHDKGNRMPTPSEITKAVGLYKLMKKSFIATLAIRKDFDV